MRNFICKNWVLGSSLGSFLCGCVLLPSGNPKRWARSDYPQKGQHQHIWRLYLIAY